ncbi:CUB and sushi domain-containing protein 1-like, partial [Diadema antillarum]|uniref:CUB and sushi domain-containing protein 1-like n=1 Tax=Diadema antillarum TaxID=105358 RepID=UPI003A86F0BE
MNADFHCNMMDEVELTNGELRQPSLLFLESDTEFDALQLHFDGVSAWINCHKLGEPEWVCETDARGTRSSYRNWDDGEPDDGYYADCASIYMLNRKFHNGRCSDQRTTICQIVVEETPEASTTSALQKSSAPQPVTIIAKVTTDVSEDQTINLESGQNATISSPYYPQPYDSNTDITWMVSVPEGCGIDLHFVTFSTERFHDSLTIADNPEFFEVADEFSGRLDPATSTEYDFSSAWIRFYSDSSVTSDGFEAIISARCIDEEHRFNLEAGQNVTILSPNYPQPYESNADITWMVSVPEGCGIDLHFVTFSTESFHDSLTIADNPDFSEVADVFSGQLPQSKSTDYDFSSAWIRFTSDSSVSSDGFEVIVLARCIDEEHTFNLESSQRSAIFFPSHPIPYYRNTRITWVVSVPEGCDMTLYFVSFSIWSTYDTLTIADNPYFSGVADEFSGGHVPPARNDYHFSPVWIKFHSDFFIASVGFEAVISATCPHVEVEPDPTSVCPSGWFPAGSKCLQINDQMWWTNAAWLCNRMDEVELTNGEMRQPSLLFVESDAEFDELQLHFDGLSAWINCHKFEESEWVCETDANGTRSSYRKQRINELDDQIRSVLDRPDLPEYDKALLYSQYLQRFLKATDNVKKPLSIEVVSDSSRDNDSTHLVTHGQRVAPKSEDAVERDILQHVPKNFVKRASQLLEKMKRCDDVGWTDKGELI